MVYEGMLAFMYAAQISRYQASGPAVLLITVGWLLFMAGEWYLFAYRLRKVVRQELTPHG
jgi:hypothetical protein